MHVLNLYSNTEHHTLFFWTLHAQVWVALKWQNRFSEDASLCCEVFVDGALEWRIRVKTLKKDFCSYYCCSLCLLQMGQSVGETGLWKMDLEHMLGIVGIVATVLNLLVVIFVYVFTPVWPAHTQTGDGLTKKVLTGLCLIQTSWKYKRKKWTHGHS